ncbi:hypothetical protein K2173_006570 [Erythroxylum novogranatense]|uniref:Uncharacterized protein n=1 Tax=Erythroxylum novogranatense TaxID=1862640 RepID=A0AAV8T5V8_9ROSI|nr:hypothetical protein K2173_006570 [Erythroxylum novogranatense]
MPSGPKKRKAAKKKREQEGNNKGNHQDSNSSSIHNSKGQEDPRYEEGRGSDCGDVDSPVSIDREVHSDERHPFSEESDEKVPLAPQSVGHVEVTRERIAEDIEGSKRVGQKDGCFDKSDGELDDYAVQIEQKIGENVDHFESVDKSYGGDERNSGVVSSDGQSQEFQQKPKGEGYHSISNEISYHSDKKAADASSAGVTGFSGNGDSLHDEEKTVMPFLSITQVSENGKPVKAANNNSGVETVTNTDMAPAVVPMSEVVKPSLEGVKVEDSEFLEVVELPTEENVSNLLPTSNEPAEVLLGSALQEEDVVLGETDGQLSTLSGTLESGNNVKISEIPDKCTTTKDAEYIKGSQPSDGILYGNEGKSVPIAHEFTSETNINAQKAKESGISDVTETQPLVSSASRVTERSSWMSCCGLFDAFTDSSR